MSDPVSVSCSYFLNVPRVWSVPRGVLNKIQYGEALPRGPTPYPFINHFGRKGTPFIYLLLKKGTPFIYLLLIRKSGTHFHVVIDK